MASTKHEIAHYDPTWDEQVAGLMVHLWSADMESNLAYLRWKYGGNPYAPEPMAIVARSRGRVVGFRGFVPLPFRTAGGGDLIVLCPGDTCVHPDHRRAGLSVRMGEAAMAAYSDRYRLFMNWSCTRPSLPGYLRMGFCALADKIYLTHASPQGTLRYLLALRQTHPLAQSRVRSGASGDLQVTAAPRTADMAALARADAAPPGTLVLHRDEAYLTWRFANPLGKYIFYYLLQDQTLAGYLAVGLSPNNQRAFLLDYAARPGRDALAEILGFILRANHFDVVSVYPFCLTGAQRHALEKLGFRLGGLLSRLELRQKGRLPLLLRPVKKTFQEDDFFIDGVDSRQIENWSLKPLGSDAG